MLENISDYLSIGILFILIIYGIRIFVSISTKNHISKVKEKENRYLAMLSEVVDDFDGEDDED